MECPEDGGCVEHQCEPRFVWDQDELKCVPKDEDNDSPEDYRQVNIEAFKIKANQKHVQTTHLLCI